MKVDFDDSASSFSYVVVMRCWKPLGSLTKLVTNF